MYEIDKAKFGAFVAALRREKGLTQKELAGHLFISDKAVSKWETGASLPDTALLIPLAEALGVSVMELLMGERVKDALEADRVEGVVKTAIAYGGEKPLRAYQVRSRWTAVYLLSLLAGGAGVFLNVRMKQPCVQMLATLVPLCAAFGAYFCCFVTLRLPDYYDENAVSVFHDGVFRMNVAGLRLNNGNWPHIVRAIRLFLCLSLALFPAVSLAMGVLVPGQWASVGNWICLGLFVIGLFASVYGVGKKYE